MSQLTILTDPRRRLAKLAEAQLGNHANSMAAAIDMFTEELEGYAEIIMGPKGVPVGFMTRGEGPSFTQRASMVLRSMDVAPTAISHHQFLANWLEHMRSFFKVEWQVVGNTLAPMAACYFRRRPEVETVLAKLHACGVSTTRQDEIRQIARSLDKNTVHFVAAAFRPGSAIHHKLYFSQYVTEGTKPVVEERVERLFDRLGGQPELRALWKQVHRKIFIGVEETTCFVSINFTDDQRLPWFKIDYPQVGPELAAEWAPVADRDAVRRDAAAACAAAGTQRLTFLGVRFGATGSHPHLKYYADVPGADQ